MKNLTNYPELMQVFKTKEGKIVQFEQRYIRMLVEKYKTLKDIPSNVECEAQEYVLEESIGFDLGYSDKVYRKDKIIIVNQINDCETIQIRSYDDGIFD